MSPSERKERIYTWRAIDLNRPARAGRSGLTYYQALMAGEQPKSPIAETIGWDIVGVEHGVIRLRLQPQEFHFHDGGVMHGGVIATLLDSAMASAVITALDEGQGCSTLSMTMNTLRPVRLDSGPLFAEGRVEHMGRKAASAVATLTDAEGGLHAKAITSCVLFPLKG